MATPTPAAIGMPHGKACAEVVDSVAPPSAIRAAAPTATFFRVLLNIVCLPQSPIGDDGDSAPGILNPAVRRRSAGVHLSERPRARPARLHRPPRASMKASRPPG